MIVLVDTSAWICYLNDIESRARDLLDEVLNSDNQVAITPTILQEILQGTRTSKEQARCLTFFLERKILLPKDLVVSAIEAAEIYLRCRRAGVTIRSTTDCQIAQATIEHEVPILDNDKDFDRIASVVNTLDIYV